jgi:hypothetical protein
MADSHGTSYRQVRPLFLALFDIPLCLPVVRKDYVLHDFCEQRKINGLVVKRLSETTTGGRQ